MTNSRVISASQRNSLYKKRFFRFLLIIFSAVSIIIVTREPAHALILDAARTSFAADLEAAGFAESGIEIFFGFLEFVLIMIPIGTGAMALGQMNRGTEAWMPWFTIMGASLVFIAFTAVVVQRVYA